MALDPILTAPSEVQIHLVAAALAVGLGPIALYRQRRDRIHKSLGYLWVSAMATLAISGLFIEAALWRIAGPFGPIHLLSVWALYSLALGLAAILRGNVAKHRAIMSALYWQALGIAGLFALLPGRRLNAALFGEAEMLGLWLIVAILAGAVFRFLWKSKWLREVMAG